MQALGRGARNSDCYCEGILLVSERSVLAVNHVSDVMMQLRISESNAFYNMRELVAVMNELDGRQVQNGKTLEDYGLVEEVFRNRDPMTQLDEDDNKLKDSVSLLRVLDIFPERALRVSCRKLVQDFTYNLDKNMRRVKKLREVALIKQEGKKEKEVRSLDDRPGEKEKK